MYEFRSWKHARGKNGKITPCHVMAMPAWADYENNKSENTSVTQMMSENCQKKVNENRHYVKTIGEIVLTTAVQNVVQRGHREGDDVTNPGNVRKFLRLIAKHDPIIPDRISTGPKNENYTSSYRMK